MNPEAHVPYDPFAEELPVPVPKVEKPSSVEDERGTLLMQFLDALPQDFLKNLSPSWNFVIDFADKENTFSRRNFYQIYSRIVKGLDFEGRQKAEAGQMLVYFQDFLQKKWNHLSEEDYNQLRNATREAMIEFGGAQAAATYQKEFAGKPPVTIEQSSVTTEQPKQLTKFEKAELAYGQIQELARICTIAQEKLQSLATLAAQIEQSGSPEAKNIGIIGRALGRLGNSSLPDLQKRLQDIRLAPPQTTSNLDEYKKVYDNLLGYGTSTDPVNFIKFFRNLGATYDMLAGSRSGTNPLTQQFFSEYDALLSDVGIEMIPVQIGSPYDSATQESMEVIQINDPAKNDTVAKVLGTGFKLNNRLSLQPYGHYSRADVIKSTEVSVNVYM